MRDVGEVTAETVSAHAGRGDPLARRIWDETTAALGRALAVMINVVEPQLVILGGGVTRAGDALLLPVRRAALSQAMRPAGAAARVELSAHGDAVGVVGAAASAFAHLGDGDLGDGDLGDGDLDHGDLDHGDLDHGDRSS
jgi:glucokinase